MADNLQETQEESTLPNSSAGPGQSSGTMEPGTLGQGGAGLPGEGGEKVPEPGSGFSGEKNIGEQDIFAGGYEKPASPRDFGSAEPGMPGNGSTGSFSAEPFVDGQGKEGNGLPVEGGEKVPEPGSGFSGEQNVGEQDIFAGGYEKPEPRTDFGSAEQGMPGNGSTGSFSAAPFVGDRGEGGNGLAGEAGKKEEIPEPFLSEKGEETVASLSPEEKALRLLPFHPSDSLRDIHFAFDRFDLDENARAILRKNAAYLKSHPELKVEIQGHCDERGSNSYNLSLGDRRARSTKSYLVSLEIDESRIHTISYGEERPFCFESNEACWYQNRRAHFLVAD